MKSFVTRTIEKLLKLDEELLPNESLQDLGLDSLMMIEMKNALQGLLGKSKTIRVGDLADCHTLHLTTVTMLNIMYSKGPGDQCAKLFERNKLIKVLKNSYKTVIMYICPLCSNIS